jgi:hypothetical protein
MAHGAEDYLCMGDWCARWHYRGENQWIWVFGTKIGVESRFGKITACPDMSTFPKF